MNIGNKAPGLDLGSMFQTGVNSIGDKGKDLQARMEALMQQDQVSPEDMMQIQFEMGQYNAALEALSSVTKSMTDMLKSLSQRTG